MHYAYYNNIDPKNWGNQNETKKQLVQPENQGNFCFGIHIFKDLN